MAKAKRKNPKLAVAYIRTSLTRQAISDNTQQAAIKQWAEREGITIVRVCYDRDMVANTALERRPGLLNALEGLNHHNAGVLVVASLDRLARHDAITRTIERSVAMQKAKIRSTLGEVSGKGKPPHKPRRDDIGRYANAPKCDGCGKPCATPIDPNDEDSGAYYTDDDVCGLTDGPGFHLCARRRCEAKREKLNVEQRRQLYTEQRAKHSTA